MKGQLQTFDGLSDEKSLALETLELKFVEHSALALSPLQVEYTKDTDAFDK